MNSISRNRLAAISLMLLTSQLDARTDEQRRSGGLLTEGQALPITQSYRPGPARINVYGAEFAAAAQATGVSEALLRAVAHVESCLLYTSDAADE